MTQTIAVIGGSGNLGAALARRWAKAGRRVIIGSRDAAKAGAAAAQLAAELGVEPGAAISGDSSQPVNGYSKPAASGTPSAL